MCEVKRRINNKFLKIIIIINLNSYFESEWFPKFQHTYDSFEKNPINSVFK